MRRPSICFHPGVQAVNEWQLDRKTDTDRPDSGASRPLAKRQHQLFGVYHQSINQGGALSICDMSTSILILKEPNISLIFILGRFFQRPLQTYGHFRLLTFSTLLHLFELKWHLCIGLSAYPQIIGLESKTITLLLVKLMRIHHGFSQLVVQNRAPCALILRLVDFVVNENL